MNTQDQRRPLIHFSVLLQDQASECGSCGESTEPGLIGWYQGKADLATGYKLDTSTGLVWTLSGVPWERSPGGTARVSNRLER